MKIKEVLKDEQVHPNMIILVFFIVMIDRFDGLQSPRHDGHAMPIQMGKGRQGEIGIDPDQSGLAPLLEDDAGQFLRF